MNTLDPYIGLNGRYELYERFFYIFEERRQVESIERIFVSV
jgi:hypothetical protein